MWYEEFFLFSFGMGGGGGGDDKINAHKECHQVSLHHKTLKPFRRRLLHPKTFFTTNVELRRKKLLNRESYINKVTTHQVQKLA